MVAEPVGDHRPVGADPGAAAQVPGGQQVSGRRQVRVRQRPVPQPVAHLGELVLDDGRGGMVAGAARGGGLVLGERLPVAAERREHVAHRDDPGTCG